jgi:hypothetical protein
VKFLNILIFIIGIGLATGTNAQFVVSPSDADACQCTGSVTYTPPAGASGYSIQLFDQHDELVQQASGVNGSYSFTNLCPTVFHVVATLANGTVQDDYFNVPAGAFNPGGANKISLCLEQYPNFVILLTSELPLCSRLRDFCFEIPVVGEDYLLKEYTKKAGLLEKDVWLEFFKKTLNEWSVKTNVVEIRNWIYICLQRNLRWTDVIMYWIMAIYETLWITNKMKAQLMDILWKVESGSGWVLVTSYRIPILWEHVHVKLAREFHRCYQEI